MGFHPPRGTSSLLISNFRETRRMRLFVPRKCAPNIWLHHHRKARSSLSTLPCLPAHFYNVVWAAELINGCPHFFARVAWLLHGLDRRRPGTIRNIHALHSTSSHKVTRSFV